MYGISVVVLVVSSHQNGTLDNSPSVENDLKQIEETALHKRHENLETKDHQKPVENLDSLKPFPDGDISSRGTKIPATEPSTFPAE